MSVNEPNGGDIRPRPDPTSLTSAAILREIAALEKVIETRLDGMDRATILRYDAVALNLGHSEEKVNALKTLLVAIMDERQHGIQNQFEERDTRTKRDAEQVKLAVDAALQAAKEAVQEQNKGFTLSIDKSDAAKTKEIDALGIRLAAATGGIEGQIGDLKDRLTRIESLGIGRAAQVIESRAESVDFRAYILLGATLVGLAIALAGYFAGGH